MLLVFFIGFFWVSENGRGRVIYHVKVSQVRQICGMVLLTIMVEAENNSRGWWKRRDYDDFVYFGYGLAATTATAAAAAAASSYYY